MGGCERYSFAARRIRSRSICSISTSVIKGPLAEACTAGTANAEARTEAAAAAAERQKSRRFITSTFAHAAQCCPASRQRGQRRLPIVVIGLPAEIPAQRLGHGGCGVTVVHGPVT